MKKKVLFVATVVKTHINAFHIPYLKLLKEMGYETHVAAKNDYENKEDCFIPNCDVFYDLPFERSPLKKENVKVYRQLKKIIQEGHYDIIHCHTPMGGVLTRLVCKQLGKSFKGVVMYTAHGFHFYKGAPLANWMFFYPVEKYLSKYTDILITHTKEDYLLAKKKFKMKKLEKVNGVGVDLKKFSPTSDDNEAVDLDIPIGKKWILSVGELIPRKNHESLIRAIQDIEDVYLTIAGRGELKTHLNNLIKELKLENRVKLLGYRNDVSKLCRKCDIFAFPSFHEGISVALMEAMASGPIIVCSKIRGNVDLIDEDEGGYFFDPENIESIKKAIHKAMKPSMNNFQAHNEEKIKLFSISLTLEQMKKIYKDI